METQADRIGKLMIEAGIPPRKIKTYLALTCGISYEAVRQWFTGSTTNIEAQHLAAIAKKFGANLDWLISGDGEMFTKAGRATLDLPRDGQACECIRVPYLGNSEKNAFFSVDWVHSLGLDAQGLTVIIAPDDSMAPRIKSGDVLLIDIMTKNVLDGRLYAVDYAGEPRIKQISKRLDGSLILRSTNSDEIYRHEELVGPDDVENIKIIGKAVLVGGLL